jgi:hypothetical protein
MVAEEMSGKEAKEEGLGVVLLGLDGEGKSDAKGEGGAT